MDHRLIHLFARFPRNVLPLGMALTAAFAHAQTPPDAGAQFSEQQRLQQRLPDRMPQLDQGETVRPALKERGGTRIRLVQIQSSGALHQADALELAYAQLFSFANLPKLVEPASKLRPATVTVTGKAPTRLQ